MKLIVYGYMKLIVYGMLFLVVSIINPTMVGVASALMVIIILWIGAREPQLFNPYILFLTTPVSLLIYSGGVSDIFLPELKSGVQVIIIIGIYAYLLGLMSLGGGSRYLKYSSPKKYSYAVVLILGLVPHILGMAVAGIPLFSEDLAAARENYTLPIIGQLMIFLPVTMLIAFERQKKLLIYLSVFLNIFFSFIMLSKWSIMFSGFFFVYAYHRYDGERIFKMRPFYVSLALLAAIPLLFEFIFAVREVGELQQTDYFWRKEVYFNSSFLNNYGDYTYLPYLYLTTPWSNFSYIVENLPEGGFSKGIRTIHSLASVFQFDSLLDITDKPIRHVPFNTHAFLSDFYMDFGVPGVVVLPYMLGLIVKWSYIKSIKHRDVMSGAIWLSMAYASFLLFFSNHFTGLSYPLLALLFFGAFKIVSASFKKP